MSKPAARIGDMHVCPMVTPGTPPIPHVGGPVVGPGCPTVLIGGMPAAVMGDMCTCVGPPDSIVLGSTGVMIGNKPAARMGDMCAHGGSIVVGCPTVLIGEMSPGSPPPPPVINMLMLSSASASSDHAQKTAQVVALKRAAESGAPFCEKCEAAREAGDAEEERKKDKTTQQFRQSRWFEFRVVPAPDATRRPDWWPGSKASFGGARCRVDFGSETETGRLSSSGDAGFEDLESESCSIDLSAMFYERDGHAHAYGVLSNPPKPARPDEAFEGASGQHRTATKVHEIEWSKLGALPGSLAIDTAHEVRVKRDVIPIIFVPGVMGSVLKVSDAHAKRPEDSGLPQLRWNPSDVKWMLKHCFRESGLKRLKMIIGERGFNEDYLDVHTEEERGWDGIMKDYHVFLERMQAHHWGSLSRFFDFPVIAFGYNWTAGNETSGRKLAERIDAAIEQAKAVAGTGHCPGVILVTHSMGGLVARACCKLAGMEDKVLGVVHGVQPATGAAAAYWRMKAGFESTGLRSAIVNRILGLDATEVTPVLANAPGPLQLLPTLRYRTNRGQISWLEIMSGDAGTVLRLPESDPYSEIYSKPADPRSEDAYWRLVDPALLDPTSARGTATAGLDGAAARASGDAWTRYIKSLDVARDFHDKLGNYAHPRSISLAGIGCGTADRVEYRVESNWFNRSIYRNSGFAAEYRDRSGNRRKAILQGPEGIGDGTVPASSASALFGRMQVSLTRIDADGRRKPMDRRLEAEHQPAYENTEFQDHAIAAIEALALLHCVERTGFPGGAQ